MLVWFLFNLYIYLMGLVARNINPFTDFGFKKLFGEEASKDILLDFLNAVLEDEVGEIVDLEYAKNEHLGTTELDRKVVFDIFCRTASGERIIIEMQKFFQSYFKERSLYYTTFAIQEQAIQGEWDFHLYPVYCISLLDFVLRDPEITPESYFHKVKLLETTTGKVFNNKLSFVYLEMPKFNKNANELETKFEKWMYLLRRLEFLERLPEGLQYKIFEKVMSIAELLKLEKTDRQAYEESLKKHRDLKNAMDTQYMLGMEKGRQEGLEQAAIMMMRAGNDIASVSAILGLSVEQLKAVADRLG
ncbi:Rpn family recombination-promoting nuclease/putative transposase [Pleomorphovibrio marinus]|uniref:Rpn family recombination-promoting nuclease/putative transposase n=1 Tax=Pleomorphovibrio marinus TaxID=2164132 RepID=UPI001E5EBF53|nr:Rpn family recombination-promoting nuclease/putative transposase [Pleomorphovibrio marinus]